LPFGVTVFAAPGDDERVLDAARAIEAVVGERMEAVLGPGAGSESR